MLSEVEAQERPFDFAQGERASLIDNRNKLEPIRRVIPAIALLLLSACAPPKTEARPALYLVADADTRIWLLGTVHALPPGVDWETRAIRAAEASAAVLVTELPAVDPDAAHGTFERWAAAEHLPPLTARVPPEARERLREITARAGLDTPALDKMKSWAAALTIAAARAAGEAGARPEHGVEAGVARRFAGKPRIGLESLDQQFALFDRLPETDQRALLAASIAAADSYPATLAAWARGDETALVRLVEAPLGQSPRLAAALVSERNARWAARIARRMARPGTLFVAVGAGHLVGDGSVIARLRAAGLRVRRLQ